MTPEEFVSCIRREVLEANLATYKRDLETSLSNSRKSHWAKTAKFYNSLTEEQRNQFIEAVQQIMLDTLSNVLGVLDGSTLLEKHRDYFHLTYGQTPTELNGDLQDILLSPET